MTEVSPQPDGRARKNLSLILNAIAKTGLRRIAEEIGKDESTVCRMKDAQLPAFAAVLSAVGLKVVPTGYQCVDADTYKFLRRCTVERLQSEDEPRLEWD